MSIYARNSVEKKIRNDLKIRGKCGKARSKLEKGHKQSLFHDVEC